MSLLFFMSEAKFSNVLYGLGAAVFLPKEKRYRVRVNRLKSIFIVSFN